MTNSGIAINLQLRDNIAVYADEARAAEADGFAMITAADHPGTCASTAAALGALAIATSSIQLCAYVLNAGTHEPLDLASDIATIDQLSGGRAMLGIGAGHTPAEWTMYGRPYPSAGARVDRLIEVVDVTTRLLAGETVTFAGKHVHADQARLGTPRPARDHIPVLIGGGGRRVLELAGRVADVLSYSGLGRTLDDGHRHEVKWTDHDTTAALAVVRSAAAAAGRTPPVVDILVQYNVITDDREAVLAKLSDGLSLPVDVASHSPFVLVGTINQQVEQVLRNRETWGISSYTVRNRKAGAALIAALT
jgi:probable F420-dependent oxidoreductase